jgi:predicted dinucleotide-binding enzyme
MTDKTAIGSEAPTTVDRRYATLAKASDTTAPPDERFALFVAGDDREAKRLVIDPIDALGFVAIGTVGLADGGRRQQPGSPLYNSRLTGAQARAALAG